jgi:hypothetical protein
MEYGLVDQVLMGIVLVFIIGILCFFPYLMFKEDAERRKKPQQPDTLEDILAQILVLHDRLQTIANSRRVDGDRVSAPVRELVEKFFE